MGPGKPPRLRSGGRGRLRNRHIKSPVLSAGSLEAHSPPGQGQVPEASEPALQEAPSLRCAQMLRNDALWSPAEPRGGPFLPFPGARSACEPLSGLFKSTALAS